MIAFDNGVLMRAIEGALKKKPDERAADARRFFEKLARDGTKIAVPAPVLIEFLRGVDKEDWAKYEQEMHQGGFRVYPVDHHVCRLAAEIWRQMKESKKPDNYPRDVLKYDALIVAVCVSRNCSVLYSFDRGLLSWSGKFLGLSIQRVPEVAQQELLHVPPNRRAKLSVVPKAVGAAE